MWQLSVLLSLFLAGAVISDPGEKLDECLKNSNLEQLDDIDKLQEASLESVCPMILGFMDCVEDVVEDELDTTIKELEEFPHPKIARGAKIFNNVKGVLQDLCTDGSDLNEAYKANEECMDTIDYMEIGNCLSNAKEAYAAFRGIENAINVDGDDEDDERLEEDVNCLSTAYASACVAAKTYDKCGQDAFDFYQTIVKRSSFIKLGLCTEEELEELKTDFLDSLEHEEEHHRDLFRLAFDLRRRKKRALRFL